MSIPFGGFTLAEPVTRRVVSESVAERIVDLITRGALLPGQKLPAERELALSLQVSRPSLREALRGLALLGVVDIRQGSGMRVSQLKPEDLLGPLSFFILLDKSNLLALFEARIFIEGGLTALAAERAKPEDVELLQGLVDRAAVSIDDSEEFLEADVQFHQLIARMSGNSLLQRVGDSLRVLGRASRELTVNLPRVRQQSHRDHVAILDAVRRGDSEAAGEAMRAHLDHVRKAYLAHGAGGAAGESGAPAARRATRAKPKARRRSRGDA
jgi:GntR family transcriptional repressor for pyruvate dehydrogenase complex